MTPLEIIWTLEEAGYVVSLLKDGTPTVRPSSVSPELYALLVANRVAVIAYLAEEQKRVATLPEILWPIGAVSWGQTCQQEEADQ